MAAWSWATRHLEFHLSGMTSESLVCSAELPFWRSSVAFELFLLNLENLLAFGEGSIAPFLFLVSITLFLILMPINGLSNLAEWNTKLLCSWDGAQYCKRGWLGCWIKSFRQLIIFFCVCVCRYVDLSPGVQFSFEISHFLLRRFERVRLLKSTFLSKKFKRIWAPPLAPLVLAQPSCECTEFPSHSFHSVFEQMICGNGESTIRSGR